METKICFKCGEDKSLDNFYVHSKMGDGHLGKCKTCTKKDTKDRHVLLQEDPAWMEKERGRHREKYKRLNYKEKHKPSTEQKRLITKRYNEKYPEKHLAKNVSQHTDRLDGNHLHHWSYQKQHWKDIIQLSIKDHFIVHRYMVYDQERMMYRTLEGVLLDTKLSHLNYCDNILLTNKI